MRSTTFFFLALGTSVLAAPARPNLDVAIANPIEVDRRVIPTNLEDAIADPVEIDRRVASSVDEAIANSIDVNRKRKIPDLGDLFRNPPKPPKVL
ncbi:hypothetical protein BDV96DRAFT_650277 [Lophiotrema nucula]|uniref:Uncharacterized protein n=1 Tax=Lophiotrema nucula TaxID=690887 RepID=A0A6A5YVS1_9PLEO|nr:hypothetical protein BDV96DRAFT_650277 [Lophiotrema nucula]